MLKKFANYMQSLGSSPHTVRGYVKDVQKAIDNGIINEDLSCLNLLGIKDLELSPVSMQRLRAAVRKYAKFLVTMDVISDVPGIISSIELPKTSTKIPNITTPERVKELMSSTDNMQVKVALGILGSTGCRISSLVTINVEDITDKEIHLTVKGNKRCTTFLPDSIRAMINEYLNGKTSGPLFCDYGGERIKVNNLRMRLKRELGSNYVNAHSIRHGLATNLLENGADLFDIKEVLHHESIATSQRYIHLTPNTIKDRLLGKHPWLSQTVKK